jgi:Raf kinase inhibitor-like YbhB/YbcL family protein
MAAMRIFSSAFPHNGAIPPKYTCDGEDVSPPLAWSEVPPEAKSLALVIEDPDAPDPSAPKMIRVHWVLYNIPPACAGLAEGARALPAGTLEGLNDWQRTGYGGPCPPAGRHRRPTRPKLEAAMQRHVLAEATLVGTYKKRGSLSAAQRWSGDMPTPRSASWQKAQRRLQPTVAIEQARGSRQEMERGFFSTGSISRDTTLSSTSV